MAEVSCAAVLIVRDEEPAIEECLQSVRELVDEIVVLDTGSTDRTREIARTAGARVVESSWRDDFAAARNEAVACARSAWILSIDADERVVRGTREHLGLILADEQPLAYRVRLRIGSLFTVSRHCRLFRNDPRIRFDGRIRESVLPSIRRIAVASGIAGSHLDALVRHCDVWLEHRDDPSTRGAKHARDLRLLELAVREQADNVLYWTDLGRALAGVGERQRALASWERAIDLVRRLDARGAADSLPYADLAQQLAPTDPRRHSLLDEASARFPQNPLFTWLRAETCIARRQFAEAEPLLRRLAAVNGDEDDCAGLAHDRRIFGEFAYAALATCCVELGQWTAAAEWFGRAADAHPQSLELRVKRDLALRRAVRP